MYNPPCRLSREPRWRAEYTSRCNARKLEQEHISSRGIPTRTEKLGRSSRFEEKANIGRSYVPGEEATADGAMGRRKGSLWSSKKASKPSSSTRLEKAAARRPEATEVPIDWGQFYDKLSTRGNSRGQCVDDLVLLEDVSNEGIVEVSECR